ncbi:RloB family protein [Photobacterium toruni]|uniref:RloB family protein n=1 Tax=Photobacterium toruni TaxID=1935446 RepID=UPI002E18DE70|nr:RloB family protein [Photobacterium toruni]
MAQFLLLIHLRVNAKMGFKSRSFDKPVYEETVEDPIRVVIISCEGSVTEPEYFNAIKEKLSDYILPLVEIEIVPKKPGPSEPQDVLLNLEKYVEKYDYKKGYDALWLICDREKVSARKKGLLDIIPCCKEKGYSLAVVNPLFELWLLFHVGDIDSYNKDILFKNDWINSSKNRRFIDKELSNILENGYNKRKGRFNKDIVTLNNIKKALQEESKFENEITNILDNLGSNVGSLIRDILELK